MLNVKKTTIAKFLSGALVGAMIFAAATCYTKTLSPQKHYNAGTSGYQSETVYLVRWHD